MRRPALTAQSPECAELGRKFREMRERRGISLRDLAQRMNVALYIIRRHEAGAVMMRVDKLLEAARIFRVRPSQLINVKEAK